MTARRRPETKGDDVKPKSRGEIRLDPLRPLIVCEGGPRDGMWFYRDDFPTMTHGGQYRGTEAFRRHPSVLDASGEIVAWSP